MWKLLRTNRDVPSLFIAQVVSFAGDWFAYVAFVGVVQDISDARSWSPSCTSRRRCRRS